MPMLYDKDNEDQKGVFFYYQIILGEFLILNILFRLKLQNFNN